MKRIANGFVILLIAYSLISPRIVLALTLSSNLTHYYKLSESSGNASDSVGSLTLTNTGTMAYQAGLIDNAATSTATAKYLHTGTDPFTSPTAYTINFWIYVTNTPASGPGQMYYASQNDCQVTIDYSNNDEIPAAIGFAYKHTGMVSITYTNTVSIRTWHMITATWDGANTNFYVDAANHGTKAIATCTGSGNALGLTLMNTSAGTRPENHMLDEVGLWTRALTSTEVTSLYNAGVGCQYAFAACTPSGNPLWAFFLF